MKTHFRLIVISGLSLFAISAQAQSALEKYMKKNTEATSTAKSQTEARGINKVFKNAEGYWRLDDTRPVGGSCSITYVAGPYHAGYVGPSAESPDALLVFIGPSIPPIKNVTRKKMTLSSASDGEVSSTFAYHSPNSQNSERGIVTFRLKNIQEAMDLMSDTEEIGITMDDKKVFSLKWKGGHVARKAMQKCLLNGPQKAGAKE